MNIFCTDDSPLHLNMIQSCLRILVSRGKPYEIVGTASNGTEFIKAYKDLKAKGVKIDVCTLDIRMPEMDGLSALVKLRSIDPSVKVAMCSSEDEKTVSKKASQISSLSDAEKFALLEKVAARIINDKPEPGKLNLILNACEELHLDPIKVAQHYKANAYLHKPYAPEFVEDVFNNILTSSTFMIKVK